MHGSGQKIGARTLIVSAWQPEQAVLVETFAGQKHTDFLLTGIGPLRAAAAVVRRLVQDDVTRVIFVGTAGAYDVQEHPLFSAWEVGSARFTDGAAALGLSYFPGAGEGRPFEEWLATKTRTEKDPSAGTAPQNRLVCVCPPSITRDVTTANALARIGTLENLEVAAVAAACAVHDVPWYAFLGVSNAVGPSAHEEWKASHQRASEAAQTLAKAFIESATR